MKSRLLVVFILVSFLSGCAYFTRRPVLTYDTILPAAPKSNIIIKITPFKDERAWSKENVGNVKDLFGARDAEIIPQNSVTEWISDAFKKELINAGYTILDNANTAITLEGTVLEVYTDAYWNYGGSVKLNIILKNGDKIILSKEYSVEKNCGKSWATTSASLGKTLELTLQDLMGKVVPDINNALLGNRSVGK